MMVAEYLANVLRLQTPSAHVGLFHMLCDPKVRHIKELRALKNLIAGWNSPKETPTICIITDSGILIVFA